MYTPGTPIGPWVIEERIGAGAMASVFRCHLSDSPDTIGALKVLGETPDRAAFERFQREAEVLRTLTHPGVVGLLDVVFDTSPPCLVMEHIAGQPLDQALAASGPLPPIAVIAIGEQIADALRYVHERGVAHRDIKPSNLILVHDPRRGAETPTVKLVDFGIALEAGRSRLTSTGFALGTVLYTPPEWAVTADLDPTRWDIFSLGVVLHEALTGAIPYAHQGEGGVAGNALRRVLAQKAALLPLDPGVEWPTALRTAITRMTEPDPDERAASAQEVSSLLHLARLEALNRGDTAFWLRIENGDVPGVRYPVRQGLTRIGRASRADDASAVEIDLADQERYQLCRWISRLHAEIQYNGEYSSIRDRNSSNGTFVNGATLEPQVEYLLEPGDRVVLGRLSFVFEEAQPTS